jgi:hypothetical protein
LFTPAKSKKSFLSVEPATETYYQAANIGYGRCLGGHTANTFVRIGGAKAPSKRDPAGLIAGLTRPIH